MTTCGTPWRARPTPRLHVLCQLAQATASPATTYSRRSRRRSASTPTPARSAGTPPAPTYGFTVTRAGFGGATYNVGPNGTAFGVANNTSQTVSSILANLNNNFNPATGTFYGGNQSLRTARQQRPERHQHGRRYQQLPVPAAPSGGVAYTPAQIRDAYGINNLALDGTGQTIAIVDAYDDPDIFQAVDAFDTQFGLTDSGPTLYEQYGPASSFLTVLNQNGQTSLAARDRPERPGHRQLGSRRSARRGMGPCHRPRAPDRPGRGQQPVALRPDGRAWPPPPASPACRWCR